MDQGSPDYTLVETCTLLQTLSFVPTKTLLDVGFLLLKCCAAYGSIILKGCKHHI
jgi:hypothetical protein